MVRFDVPIVFTSRFYSQKLLATRPSRVLVLLLFLKINFIVFTFSQIIKKLSVLIPPIHLLSKVYKPTYLKIFFPKLLLILKKKQFN